MNDLDGWEHDCGFHSTTESLFLAHLEQCDPSGKDEPIYQEIITRHGHLSEAIGEE